MNREDWLNEAVTRMRPWFDGFEVEPPSVVRVSTGWSRGAKKNQVGWCWRSDVATDKSSNIFISPEQSEPVKILATLLHELCHASDDCRDSHAGRFRRLWKLHGFEGKPTTSVPGPELFKKLETLASELGEYPHSELKPGNKIKTQKTFMIKLECRGCSMIIRTTQKWLDSTGLPSCACGEGGFSEEATK